MGRLQNLTERLKENSYPGRGILVGKTEDGKQAVFAYFIMGRSENSRNRIFVEEGEGIRTEAFDTSKLTDPSLIIYSPVRVWGDKTIITNGDQTDTIYHYLDQGKGFREALRTRAFEPDAPNFTPRISAVAKVKNGKLKYKLSILKCGDENGKSCERFYFDYDKPLNGEGRLIHTYQCDGDPIPSFSGEPVPVKIEGNIDTFTDSLWKALNKENKVSLFVRFVSLKSGKTETKIVNKNKKK